MGRYATIDIGTNTILMLIAESDGSKGFKVIRDEHSLARLGQGIGLNNKKILPEAIDRADVILRNYRKICDEQNVSELFAVATSAMRDAENREEVKKIFSSILGTEINIISGEKESKFSFIGAVEDNSESVVIDIGGGSTEIIYGNINEIKTRNSLQMGAVRITEAYMKEQPAKQDNLKEAEFSIVEQLKLIQKPQNIEKVYAVAGTPTTLAGIMLNLKEFDRDYIQGYKLEFSDIVELYNSFCKLSIEEIINIYSVKSARADVITAGTLILIKILEHLKTDYCIASTKGLRYGMMKYLAAK